MKICLSQLQREYLVDDVLKGRYELLNNIELGKLINNKWQFEISNDIADEIRDLCSEKLQIVGFDEKYRLTEKGKLLEDLIDLFCVSI
jgi:hypothetical protein